MCRDPSVPRDFWTKVGDEVKAAKVHIQPLLRNWLLISASEDEELQAIRDAYLPETVLAYVCTLHFAGTSMSRDNLLECMELAATIAEKDSDLTVCFVKAKRMRELVEAFASCSRALAGAAGDKKSSNSTGKRLREMGWSRDLWSVRQDA
jgi:nuclear pore complex protein Nup107